VLASPRDSRNIGAVCRAMKNMGLAKLAIAGNSRLNKEEIRILSVHAFDVFENAAFFDDLQTAIAGATFTCGITRRRGKFRKYYSLLPKELAEKISAMKRGSVALVFGNEEAGLTDGELALCHVAVHIPTSPAFPSLNLSHAVQIIAYELFANMATNEMRRFTPVAGADLDCFTEEIVSVLGSLGFFTQVTPSDTTVFLRDIFARAMLDNEEAKRIRKIFKKIQGIAGRKTGP
jgi:tRNA/rRNA methyltransferase